MNLVAEERLTIGGHQGLHASFPSATTTASIFLWTSIPAILGGINLSSGAESVARHIGQGRERSPGLTEKPATLNYSINHARLGSNSSSASTAPLARFDLAAPGRAILTGTRILVAFRGLQAQG